MANKRLFKSHKPRRYMSKKAYLKLTGCDTDHDRLYTHMMHEICATCGKVWGKHLGNNCPPKN
jgi:hypothetical protein